MRTPAPWRQAIIWSRLLRLCTLLLAYGLSIAAAAGQVPQPDPSAGVWGEQDQAAVSAAARDAESGGATALVSHVASLTAIQARTPKGYRKIEAAGSEMRYRASNLPEFLEYAAWSEAQSKARGTAKQMIVWLPDTYLQASYLLGWFYNETKQYDKALAVLDRGMILAPGDGRLAGEYAQALLQLGRLDAALAFYVRTLGTNDFLPARIRALLLRGKGFALTEKRQFDAAEQAYRDSLTFEPDHLGAKHELAYIARLRGGTPATPSTMTTYDKAKQGNYGGKTP